MEMEEIDVVLADLLEVGDYITFDGVICAIKSIEEAGDEYIRFISEDDREITHPWDARVDVFGYVDVDV